MAQLDNKWVVRRGSAAIEYTVTSKDEDYRERVVSSVASGCTPWGDGTMMLDEVLRRQNHHSARWCQIKGRKRSGFEEFLRESCLTTSG